MIKKLKEKLNPKISRKISRYLIEDKFSYEQYHEESDEFKIIHNNFLNYLKKDFSIESTIEILNVLETEIEKKLLIEAVNQIKKIEDVSLTIDFFILHYKKKIYGKNTLVLLNLLFNKWLHDNGYSIFILYPSFRKELENVIKYGGDLLVMRELIISFYNDSLVRNTVYEVRNTKDVIKDIMKYKTTLKEQYRIEKLYIFGSYSTDKQNEFSDLDIYINTNSKKSVFELESINDYLSIILNLKVNVVLDNDFIHYQMLEVF